MRNEDRRLCRVQYNPTKWIMVRTQPFIRNCLAGIRFFMKMKRETMWGKKTASTNGIPGTNKLLNKCLPEKCYGLCLDVLLAFVSLSPSRTKIEVIHLLFGHVGAINFTKVEFSRRGLYLQFTEPALHPKKIINMLHSTLETCLGTRITRSPWYSRCWNCRPAIDVGPKMWVRGVGNNECVQWESRHVINCALNMPHARRYLRSFGKRM